MYLHLRSSNGSWFAREPVLQTRSFGHREMPPQETFAFAARLWDVPPSPARPRPPVPAAAWSRQRGSGSPPTGAPPS